MEQSNQLQLIAFGPMTSDSVRFIAEGDRVRLLRRVTGNVQEPNASLFGIRRMDVKPSRQTAMGIGVGVVLEVDEVP